MKYKVTMHKEEIDALLRWDDEVKKDINTCPGGWSCGVDPAPERVFLHRFLNHIRTLTNDKEEE